jgi:cobalt-zinc-cadmium efflux system outer membrane protein
VGPPAASAAQTEALRNTFKISLAFACSFAAQMRTMTVFSVKYRWIIVVLSMAASSCGGAKYVSRKTVTDKIMAQSGYTVPEQKKAGAFDWAPGVDTTDGINEQEAVNIALWNNALFQSDLSNILLANADVTNAGIIQNPLLRYLSPNAGILASGYVNFAIDFIWQRPGRIAAAKLNADRVKDSLVQLGFTLIRDVQVAFTNVQFAEERYAITFENAATRAEINRLANVRLRNGDISELEAATSKADSASAVDDLVKSKLDLVSSRNQLNFLLGIKPVDTLINYKKAEADTLLQRISKQDYLSLALAYRPDLEAAKTAIAAAGRSLGWEKSRIISFTATLNFQYLNETGGDGKNWLPNAANPGIQAEIPLFNRNQGNIQKANASLEKATLQYEAVLQNVMLDVIQAWYQYEQNYQSYLLWRSNVLPPLEQAVSLVKQTYERGDISYLPVLEAIRQLQNGRLRSADVTAQLRRAISQLNYSIGQKLK